jgi:hypothetical protein
MWELLGVAVLGMVCYLYGCVNTNYQWVNCAHNNMLMRIKDKIFIGQKYVYEIKALGQEREDLL